MSFEGTISFSISDESCKAMLHYIAPWNEKAHAVTMALLSEFEIDTNWNGVHLDKETTLKGLQRLLELIKTTNGTGLRVTKTQAFIDHSVKPAPADATFYLHISGYRAIQCSQGG